MKQPDFPAPARLSPATKPAHGFDNRGLEAGAIPGAHFGRFGRLFPFSGNILPDQCLRDIAGAMIKADVSKPLDEDEAVDENPAIPAGYTYFGQFVDHDITLDPTPLKAKNVDVCALEDFRTPALDLDCIYGTGPGDQPYLYRPDPNANGELLQLRLGAKVTAADAAVGNSRDLLRLRIDGEVVERALIGDKRNDENRIVSQVQALFIAFHNKVIQDQALIEQVGGIWEDTGSRFRSAVNIVRWHYQWLVLNDYLRRVLEPGAIAERFDRHGVPNLPLYDRPGLRNAYLPVEFAGAAYRFGHSMVRPGYALNLIAQGPTQIPDPSDPSKTMQDGRISLFSRDKNGRSNLNGFGVPLPDDWGIDWSFFLDHVAKTPGHSDLKIPQPSYRIDAQLVGPLADLPEFFGEGVGDPADTILGNLAYRNLVRGVANLRLPSGEQIARALGIVPLGPDILWTAGSRRRSELPGDDEAQGDIDATNARRKLVADNWVSGTGAKSILKGNTPLWYYILREAEWFGTDRVQEGATVAFGGQYLGPVGSRLIAETFVGLLWNDPMSYLRRWPTFQPLSPIAADPSAFTLGELATWVSASD